MRTSVSETSGSRRRPPERSRLDTEAASRASPPMGRFPECPRQRRYGAERVAIVDFDAHHGNGSQQIFWSDRTVMYCSTHEMPLFPGTGEWSECGEYNNVVNVPLRAGDGGETFREALDIAILPRLQDFSPDLIVISAGFDAHKLDPLSNLRLSEADFGWATHEIMEIADRRSAGKVISVLEGGYALQSLASSVAAHVTALMES